MPRFNVYLPSGLAAAARPLGLNLSQVLQVALREQIDSTRIETWLGHLDLTNPGQLGHETALQVLERVEPRTTNG
ncbi:MAG TPA: type II toxin-antitoxin system CcdA family antitoxin [Candidatus Dormibacteraeota bacterium]|nr:type II toxin-antitoxin system CcdA family antitoxin [Candidatus Dormibacteraeota bacterium]